MRSNKIRKFVIFISGLLLLLFLMSHVLTTGARYSVSGEDGKINRLMKHEVDPEIMIFGPSVALVHFNAALIEMETGLSAFNMGIDGTSIQQYKGLVKEFTNHTQKCKYVIFAVYIHELQKRIDLYNPENFYHHIDNPNVYEALYKIDPDYIWKVRHVPFYKMILFDWNYLKNVKKGWRNFIDKTQEDNMIKGYFPYDREWEASLDIKNDTISYFNLKIEEEVLADFEEVIGLLNAKGIKSVIVLTPTYKGGVKSILNWEEYKQAYRKLVNESNSYFWDYSGTYLSEDKSVFYNNTHLNRKGADIFSLDFGKKLNNFILNRDSLGADMNKNDLTLFR